MTHTISFRSRIIRSLLSLMRERFATWSVEETRRLSNVGIFPLPPKAEIYQAEGIEGQWIDIRDVTSDGVILYLHGGGYILNTSKTHQPFVARLCVATKRRALYLDYRLAPEHVFPEALDDTMAAYRWLLAQGIPASRIILAGDSAGAALALAAMVQLREAGLPLPAAAVLLSPLCDLTLTSPSAVSEKDPIYTRETLLKAGQLYAGNTPLDHPLLSPVNADLRRLPPMLIQVGGVELLRDDAIVLANRIRLADGQVTLSIYENLWHVWLVYPPLIVPEARVAIQEIATFLRSHIA